VVCPKLLCLKGAAFAIALVYRSTNTMDQEAANESASFQA
jgi:hypothetical protein